MILILKALQIFGADSILGLGAGKETEESRQQWAEDMDIDVRPLSNFLPFYTSQAALPSLEDINLASY